MLITVLLLELRTTVTDSRVAHEPRTPSDIAHCQWRSLPGGAQMILRENHAPRLSDKLTHRAHMHEGRMLSCAVRTSVYQPDFLAGHEASTRRPPRRDWKTGSKAVPSVPTRTLPSLSRPLESPAKYSLDPIRIRRCRHRSEVVHRLVAVVC